MGLLEGISDGAEDGSKGLHLKPLINMLFMYKVPVTFRSAVDMNFAFIELVETVDFFPGDGHS